MIITNKYNLPQTFVNIMKRPTYSKGKANISATELLTDEGRKKNADAQAKISKLAGMLTIEKRELQQIADRSRP